MVTKFLAIRNGRIQRYSSVLEFLTTTVLSFKILGAGFFELVFAVETLLLERGFWRDLLLVFKFCDVFFIGALVSRYAKSDIRVMGSGIECFAWLYVPA